MKKQISIFLILFLSLSTIQAQKLESVEKKVFSYLIKNVEDDQLPILSYCLELDLDSVSIDNVKIELIKTSKNTELKNIFYKNGNQFDSIWISYLLNPIVKNPTGKEPKRVLNEDEYVILIDEIKKYPHKNIDDTSILILKAIKNLENKFKSIDLKDKINIWDKRYSNQIQYYINEILEYGIINTDVFNKYLSSITGNWLNPMNFINPKIYKEVSLFNNNEVKILAQIYKSNILTNGGECCLEMFLYAEENAEFPGGNDLINKYIKDNLIYPLEDKNANIDGKVVAKVGINKLGNICSIELIKKVSSTIDAEAIRIIESMPRWKPAQNQNRPVCVYFQILINFRLKD